MHLVKKFTQTYNEYLPPSKLTTLSERRTSPRLCCPSRASHPRASSMALEGEVRCWHGMPLLTVADALTSGPHVFCLDTTKCGVYYYSCQGFLAHFFQTSSRNSRSGGLLPFNAPSLSLRTIRRAAIGRNLTAFGIEGSGSTLFVLEESVAVRVRLCRSCL